MSKLKLPKPKIIKLSQVELSTFLERIKESTLAPSDRVLIEEVFQGQQWFYRMMEAGQLTMRKFRDMLFCSKSERRRGKPDEGADSETGDSNGAEASNDSNPNKTPSNSTGDKPKAKGHGRLGAKNYPNREQVPVHHPDLKSGDPCPEPPCPGHLYTIAPGSFVHITGQSMAKVTEYVMDKLRCSACGVVVTAPLPETTGSEKYDETFKSLVVLNRYFTA